MNIKVSDDEAGQKIIKYLLRKTNGTKIFIHKLLRKGLIKVNNNNVNKDYIIKANDIISSNFLEIYNRVDNSLYELDQNLIVYEDENIIVVDKEANIPLYASNRKENNLIDMIKKYYKNKNFNLNYIQPVHRLDKKTRGVLIFSKNYKILKKYSEYFKNGLITKIYLAEVTGNFYNFLMVNKLNNLEKILLVANIIRNENKSLIEDLNIITDIPEKKSWFLKNNDLKTISATIIKPLYENQNNTVLEIELWTGRHHQIRALCSYLGYPVVGDNLYGNYNQEDKLKLICKKIIIEPENLIFESKFNI